MLENSLSIDQSFAFLTMHKAGSSFAVEIVRGLFVRNGWLSCDMASDAFALGCEENEYIMKRKDRFRERHTFFGPIRGETIEMVSSYRSLVPIVHIRDPRDCLVSNYYSICFSHVLPGPGHERDRFEALREYHRQQTIDEFCLDVITKGDRSFALLRAVCERSAHLVQSRYEDMVGDFSGWIKQLVGRLPIRADAECLARLDPSEGVPAVEDIYRHRRQVLPGDFRRKLKLETQTRLTEWFCSDLKYFGYATDY